MPERFYARLDAHYAVPDEERPERPRRFEDDLAAVWMVVVGFLTRAAETPATPYVCLTVFLVLVAVAR